MPVRVLCPGSWTARSGRLGRRAPFRHSSLISSVADMAAHPASAEVAKLTMSSVVPLTAASVLGDPPGRAPRAPRHGSAASRCSVSCPLLELGSPGPSEVLQVSCEHHLRAAWLRVWVECSGLCLPAPSASQEEWASVFVAAI